MKQLIINCLFSFIAITSTSQQLTPEVLNADIERVEFQIKEINVDVSTLRKLISEKKKNALIEKDKALILKNEVTVLEAQVKQKNEELHNLKKLLQEKKKQIADGKKQLSVANVSKDIAKINNIASGVNLGDYVEVFEHPSYQGKSVKYFINKKYEDVSIPFSSNAISIKFSNENRVILFFAEQNPTQLINGSIATNLKTIIASTPLYNISTTNIVTVLVGTKRKIEVDFNGFIYAPFQDYSYSIHNNDCKRVYGTVDYNLTMTLYSRVAAHTARGYLLNASTATPVENVTVFNQPKNNVPVCSFVYNASNEANLTPRVARERGRGFSRSRHTALYSVPDLPRAKQYFYVDSASYQYHSDAKYQFEATIKIGSAHKGCDICTDFTWDAEMLTEEKIKFKLPNDWQQEIRGVPGLLDYDYIQIGPFRGLGKYGERRGERPGGSISPDNFKGPEHPTYVQFIIKGSQRN